VNGEGDNRGETKEEKRKRMEKDDYEVSGGWLREEAILLLRRFYVQSNERGEFLLLFDFRFVYYVWILCLGFILGGV